jgi:hypothetical protein
MMLRIFVAIDGRLLRHGKNITHEYRDYKYCLFHGVVIFESLPMITVGLLCQCSFGLKIKQFYFLPSEVFNFTIALFNYE